MFCNIRKRSNRTIVRTCHGALKSVIALINVNYCNLAINLSGPFIENFDAYKVGSVLGLWLLPSLPCVLNIILHL